MPSIRAATLAAATALLVVAPAAQAKPQDIDSTALRRAVTTDGIVEHQRALQFIADNNDGTRDTTTPGYLASVDYVKAKMEAAGLNVSTTQFNMPDWKENAPPVLEQLSPTATTYTPGKAADDNSSAVDFITFRFSPTKAPARRSCPRTTSRSPAPVARPAAARRRITRPPPPARSR
jgi:hypothetical protein